MNFNLNIIVVCAFSSNTFIMANPDISSINGASTFINLCSFGFITTCSFGKVDMDLFRKIKQQFHEFMTPSNSNIVLIPNTKSAFLCISDINIYISNLCPCMSTIIGIMNNTLMNCPFPT